MWFKIRQMFADQSLGESLVRTKKDETAMVFSEHGVEAVPKGFDRSQMSPECCSLEDLNTCANSVVKST